MSRGKFKQIIKKPNQQGENMKNLISVLNLITIAFFVSGCSDTGSIFNSPVNQPDKMVFTISGSADGLTTAPYGTDKPYRHFEGDGTSAPGGQSHVILDYWALPVTPTSGNAGFGNGVLITENGDKLFVVNVRGMYVIDPVSHVVTCDTYFDIAGGTGDYDNVIGLIHLTATINQDRTTHGEWTGTFSHARPISGEFTALNGTVQNPSCSAGYTRRHAEGNGTVMHLGSCFAVTEHCVNFTTGVITNGSGQLKANNGDQINVTYDGFVVPIPGTNTAAVKMFCTVTGGTGKYANAEGYFLLTAVQEMPEGAASCTFDGAIDY
jgi:hypothetical protein